MPDDANGAPSPAGMDVDTARLAPGLYWGINSQFLNYLARMSDSRCSTTDGADLLGGNIFRFEPEPGNDTGIDPTTGTGVLRFRGDVRFAGHYGFLFVRIADPWLTVENGAATLSVITHPTESERLTLITAVLTEEGVDGPIHRMSGKTVRLTAAGRPLFNDVYPEDAPFDDFSVLWPG
ncbi:HtaA domain-containing protein [Streptomyces sp. JV176]|uniref:HtaA domain-containing protein n=1 Tax=Streptomyces sp. JV176 TaxID=858630 RepID=UPI002E799D99|nr:HtaA domain-containing protein [Streptomyces sp. JV176]MEE1798084.1 HtaA domain-containing protein [Streptomyces sp. JV176]